MLDNFSLEIEKRAAAAGSYIEAIVDFKEERGIDDFEDIVEQLHPQVIDKIKAEFIAKNFFPGKRPDNALPAFLFK